MKSNKILKSKTKKNRNINSTENPHLQFFNSIPKKCYHCGNDKIRIHQHYEIGKRYRCLECKKTFMSTSGTILYKVRKQKLLCEYSQKMSDNESIRTMARYFKISSNTSFYWRHKLLSCASVNTNFTHKNDSISEISGLELPFNNKGQSNSKKISTDDGWRLQNLPDVSITLNYNKLTENVNFHFACFGKIESIEGELGANLDSVSDKIIFSDSFKSLHNKEVAYPNFIDTNIQLKLKSTYLDANTENANRILTDFEKWFEKFNGVATKYLSNYLNWYNLIYNSSKYLDQKKEISKQTLWSKNGLEYYKNISQAFKKKCLSQTTATDSIFKTIT